MRPVVRYFSCRHFCHMKYHYYLLAQPVQENRPLPITSWSTCLKKSKFSLCISRQAILSIYQLLDEAEHDMKNYANRGGSYPPKLYSSYHAKAEFNNWFIIHSKYSQRTKNIENESLFNAIFHLHFSC